MKWNGTSEPVYPTGEQLASAGASLAADFAGTLNKTDWTLAAISFLRGWAPYRKDFISSDFREAFQSLIPDHPKMDPRAYGHVMRVAVKDGIITAAGGYRKSGRRTSHNRDERIWKATPNN